MLTDLPTLNTLYRHHSGAIYEVYDLTNTRQPPRSGDLLPTVSYRDQDGHQYSRPIDTFLEKFTRYFPESITPLHRCPLRHSHSPLPQDSWLLHANQDRVCSYCGSIHPHDYIRISQDPVSKLSMLSPKSYHISIARPTVPDARWGATYFLLPHLKGIDEVSLTV